MIAHFHPLGFSLALHRLGAFLLLSSLLGCTSPGVWRSAEYGPENPVPTLLAAVVFDVQVEEVEVQTLPTPGGNSTTTVDLGDVLGKATGRSRSEEALSMVGPKLVERAIQLLERNGFRMERNANRAAKLKGLPPARAFNPAWEAPGTSERTFHDLAVIGGLSPVLEAVQTSREREAYVSLYAQFHGHRMSGNDFSEGADCNLILIVLDKAGETVFEARGSGVATAAALEEGSWIPMADAIKKSFNTSATNAELSVAIAAFEAAMSDLESAEVQAL